MPPALLRMQRPATGRRETECVERAAPMVLEQELIERIRRGDLVSFKAVFERYYGGVHAFTRGVVDNGFHAEEITQNVFIRLWLKREALDPSRNFKAFLYTLARHEIADYFRSDRYDRRRLRLDLLHDAEHVQEQFAAAYDADRLRQLVLDEIDRMPAQRREVFRLSRIEGQVRGIHTMLDKDVYCADILVQVAAVNAALNGFSKELLSQHVRTCVADDLRAGGTQKLDELLQLLPRLMK